MGLFGFLAGDPSKKWVRDPDLKLAVELRDATLAGVRLGSRPEGLSKLGPPAGKDSTRNGFYGWLDRGIYASAQKGILVSFTLEVNEKTPDPDLVYYPGVFLLDGKPLPLGRETRKDDVVRLLGAPWHEYSDPDDDEIGLTLWYETRTLEWSFEFLTTGTLSAVVLASPPDLGDERTREQLKCDKPWPP